MIFPKITIDQVNRATEVYEYASGKSLNVARVLQSLGEEPIATGFLGGPRGKFCREQLDEIGLRHEFVTVAAPTRLCTTVIDSDAGTVTELVEESKAVESADWQAMDQKLERLLSGCQFAIFSGSLPPGAPEDLYDRWLGMAERTGVRAIVDARDKPLQQAISHRGAIIKVNLCELQSTLGMDAATSNLRDMLEAACPPWGMIAVTNGANGAVAYDRENFVRIPPIPIVAVNPIGSGDAFAAGLAAGLAHGNSFADACLLASAAAASNATSPLAGDVRRHQVDTLLKQAKWSALE
jgi:tagatose 6-phosphate kinase